MDFNKELEKEIIEFNKTQDMKHFDNILNLFPYSILRTPAYFVDDPILNKEGNIVIKKDNVMLFNIIEDKEGNKYIPVFTSHENYIKMPNIEEASIYHLEFKHIVDIFSIESDLYGIVINPTTDSIVIEKDIIFELNEFLKD